MASRKINNSALPGVLDWVHVYRGTLPRGPLGKGMGRGRWAHSKLITVSRVRRNIGLVNDWMSERRGWRGMGHGAIERKREEGKSGETNDLARRDRSQSIIFKQKQCCPREHLRSAYLIKSPSLHIYGHPPSNINLLGWDGPVEWKGICGGDL